VEKGVSSLIMIRIKLLEILRCPRSGQRLNHKEGFLISEDRKHIYPIKKEIPRFVPESNYSDNFGLQWNIFARTQLDSYSGHAISANRFWKSTAWDPLKMKGKWVLDAGCGSGRFAEIALATGANVVALDYSSAIDACWNNLKENQNLYVVQANIYEAPFAPNSFDYVYSLGVLQHTPDVKNAFSALPPLVVKGGGFCVDLYEKSVKKLFHPKSWIRPLTKKINKNVLFKVVKKNVPFLLRLSQTIGRVPLVGKIIKKIVPVANYEDIYPLSKKQLEEWAVLDTFDWLSPVYDNPQKPSTLVTWMQDSEMQEIEVVKAGHLVARGVKK